VRGGRLPVKAGPALILAASAATVAVAAALGVAPPAGKGASGKRPNVIVIMTDDQRVYDMEAMPQTRRLIGRRGTTFENAFATYPLCCPSRSTFLSGQYEHNHGVQDNDPPEGGYSKFDFSNALGVWLQNAGYKTAHIGKQLNGYGALTEGGPIVAPGYDDWFATRDPSTYLMYNYVVSDNGIPRPYGIAPEDYQTDVLANRVIEDIREWAPEEQPFFIHFTPSAVHWEFIDAESGPRPAPRHKGLFADHAAHPRPNFDEQDISDKPSVVHHFGPIDSELSEKIARKHRTRLESLLAVDEAVGRIVRELRQLGELDNTLIVFTSDNGYFHGEHRLPSEKVLAYEESIRVPLLVRGPGFPAGVRRQPMVGNIDMAPTIVELAGAEPGRAMDGESLLPFAANPRHRRDRALVFEADFEQVEGVLLAIVPEYVKEVNVYYDAIRTRRYKYVHWFRDVDANPANEEELYDLKADPFELQSLHDSPRHAALKAALMRELKSFKDCVGSDCRRSLSPPPPPCLRGRLAVRRDAISSLRPRAGVEELLTRTGSPTYAHGRHWRFCARGGGHVDLAFSPGGALRLIATTARTGGARGVGRGTRLAALRRAYPNTHKLIPGVLSAGEGGLVFGVGGDRVRFVGLTDRGLISGPRAFRRYLRLFR
jgi:N-acetylglucosamine-6-sulfatase